MLIRSLFMFIIFLLLTIPVFSYPNYLSVDEIKWLRAHDGRIRWAPDSSFKPFEYIDNDKFTGIGSDYIHLIEKKLDIKFIVVKTSTWLENVILMKNRELDVWGSAVKTQQRSEFMNFSIPYYKLSSIFIIKSDFEGKYSLQKSSGDKIGVIGGYYTHDYLLSNYDLDKIVQFDDVQSALKAVSEDKVVAMLTDIATSSLYIDSLNLHQLKNGGEVIISNAAVSLAVRNDWPIFINIINKALDRVTEEEHKNIIRKFVQMDSDNSLPVEYLNNNSILLSFVSFIIIAIVVMMIFRFHNKISDFIRFKRKFWIIISVAIFITFLVFLLIYNIKSSNNYFVLTQEERKWLDDNPNLKIAPDYSFAPIEFIKNKEFKGIAADYVKLLETKLDYKFEITYIKKWSDNVASAKSKKHDIWSAVAPTLQKEKYMLFTKPYLNIKSIIIASQDDDREFDMNDMKGKVIAIVDGYFTHDYMKKNYPLTKLMLVPNALAGLRALAFKEVDSMLIDVATASYLIEQEGLTTLRVVDSIDTNYHLSFAIRNDMPILRDILDKALGSISQKEQQYIYQKWISYSDKNTDLLYKVMLILISIVVIFTIAFIVFFILNRSLRKIIYLKTRQLEKTKEYLKNIIDFMPSMLIGIDKNYRITQWNLQAEKVTNLSVADVLGQRLDSVLSVFVDEFKSIDINKGVTQFIHNFISKKNGEEKHYNITILPLTIESDTRIVIRIDDITENEKRDAQLQQSQKMEMVGTLAGGLAHDFNNVLGGIIGTVSIIKLKLSRDGFIDSKLLKKYLETIDKSGERATEMVKQLLTVSRKQDIVMSPIDLNKTIRTVMNICENTFEKSISLNLEYAEKSAIINADSAQIEQVILNFCVNAAHAMTVMRDSYEEWGGKLNISIARFKPDEHFLNLHPKSKHDEYWVVSVEDTGIGMTKDTISKIFTPFFTLKGQGAGTGLGLSMVYSIVNQHNGFVDVYSEIGVGSLFKLYIPTYNNEIEQDKQRFDNTKLSLSGEGTILIIDDEEIMRITASEILKECGFNVICTSGGQEAVDIYREQNEIIRAVVLDMAMPGLNGKETYLLLKEINTDVIVLLASGFKLDKRVNEVLELGVKGFIQKPYSFESLYHSLSNIL